jgi:hypothetical protein
MFNVMRRICPIGDRIRALQADPAYLDAVFRDGQETAMGIATHTMDDVKHAMGLQ